MFGVQCIHTSAMEKHVTAVYKFRNEGYFVFSSQKTWQVANKQYYELQGHGPLFADLVMTTNTHSEDFIAHLKTWTDVIYMDKIPFDEFTDFERIHCDFVVHTQGQVQVCNFIYHSSRRGSMDGDMEV